MNTFNKVAVVTTLSLSLIGCGGDVDIVKETPFFADPSLTTGQALDNRDICEDVVWETLDNDKYDRPVIEYRCILDGAGDYYAKEGVDVVKAEEVFRWSYNDEHVFYVYGGLHLTRGDDSVYEKTLMTRKQAMNGGSFAMENLLKEIVNQRWDTYERGAKVSYFPWISARVYKRDNES